MKTRLKYLVSLVSVLILVLNLCGEDSLKPTARRIRIAKLLTITQQTQDEIDWFVDLDQLARQSKWDGLTSDIPLPSAKAASICLAETKKHYPEIKDWMVQAIMIYSLSRDPEVRKENVPSDVWYYQIRVVPKDYQKLKDLEDAGKDTDLYQVVLMDGSIVKPVRSVYH
jgi:hypothetical protein